MQGITGLCWYTICLEVGENNLAFDFGDIFYTLRTGEAYRGEDICVVLAYLGCT